MAIHFANTELSDCIGETWRVTSSFNGDVHPIVNWEVADQTGGGNNFSVCTESNGVFSFNQLGWYHIHWWMYISGNVDSPYNEMMLEYSWNNAANYATYQYAQTFLMSGTTRYSSAHAAHTFSVPGNSGSSARKFRFKVNHQADSSVSTAGSSGTSHTGFTIVKIADI